MQNTTLMVVGSLIVVTFILILVVGGYIVPRQITVPEKHPVEVRLVQKLACTLDYVEGTGFTMAIPSSYTLYLDTYIKSATNARVTIDEIKPIAENVTLESLKTNITLNPGEVYMKTIVPPWGQINQLTITMKPGDVAKFEAGSLVFETTGTINEYIETVPSKTLPNSYTPPFYGRTKYELTINGNKMAAEIQDPGYAARQAASTYGSKLLVLAEFEPEDYYYKDYDIPFYIDLYKGGSHTGFYLYANGRLGIIGGNYITVSTSNTIYAGFWYSNGHASLYVGDNKAPSLTSSAPDVSNGAVAVGVAREREAESKLKLMLVFWNHGGTNFYFDGQWKHKETDYLYFVADPNSGTSYLKMWGPGRRGGSFNNPESWWAPPVDSSVCRSVPPYFWVMEVNPPGPNSCDPSGKCHGKELLDLIIGWDDTQGTCIEERFRVTIFEDGYARVEHLSTAGSPYDEVFIAPTGNYAPGSDGDGDGYPDNWFHIWSLTNDVGGVVWKDVSQFITWERYPVSSRVHYLGLFRDQYIKIKGLFPGDRIIVYSRNTMKSFTASSSEFTLNVIETFGVRETIETLKAGGFRIVINPSQQHLLYLLPVSALVHVKSEKHDMWLKTDMPVVIDCKQQILVNSENEIPFIAETENYVLWNVTFNGEKLGMFPSVIISIADGYVRLYSDYGVYTYSGTVTVTLTPPQYVGVAKGGIQPIAVPRVYRVEVHSSRYSVVLASGK